MNELRAATIDNRVYIFGGYDGGSYYDTILEYDATSDSYTEAGTMTQARFLYAVSVVQYEEYSQWCQ